MIIDGVDVMVAVGVLLVQLMWYFRTVFILLIIYCWLVLRNHNDCIFQI